MQNRNMFLYRRQGPKKRPKSGTPRKGRNPQKGLPNSARDLLPIIQPATKALAQMLAGRTAASGQLGHARAVLAQTEKLVSERAHNRLNPAEREEFFEQVARLKLTLSDAESEAEFQAAEEQQPAQPSIPVDRERLKAMAMSLTSSGAKNAASGSDPKQGAAFEDRAESAPSALNEEPAADLEVASADQSQPQSTGDDDVASDVTAAAESADRPIDPKQLRLPRNTADKLALQSAAIGSVDDVPRRRKAKSTRSKAPAKPASQPQPEPPKEDGLGDRDEPLSLSKTAKGEQKLPKGWIIDDEGFVVPGPS